jgi:hypothetical protein
MVAFQQKRNIKSQETRESSFSLALLSHMVLIEQLNNFPSKDLKYDDHCTVHIHKTLINYFLLQKDGKSFGGLFNDLPAQFNSATTLLTSS